MPTNIYDIAYTLQNALKEQPEFQSLQSLYKQVLADPVAKPLFAEFQKFQMTLQQKMMQGQQITQQESAHAQALFTQASQNPLIAQVMQTEQRLNTVIQDLNKIVLKPLEELYSGITQ